MKNLVPSIFLSLVLFLPTHSLSAQSTPSEQKPPSAYAESVTSQDQILETLYSVISGEKGEARDWNQFRYLFHPEAKLIPTRKAQDGKTEAIYWTVEDYISKAGGYLVQNGFFEKEIHRQSNTFGGMTQVFSTYESYRSASDTEPFARGINSIQLLHDGERWWIINIYWHSESEENPLPEEYLPRQ